MNRMVPLEAIAQYQYPSSYQYALYDPSGEAGEEYFTMGGAGGRLLSKAELWVAIGLIIASVVGGVKLGLELLDEAPDSVERSNVDKYKKLWLWALVALLVVGIVVGLLGFIWAPLSVIVSVGLGVAGVTMLYMTLGKMLVDLKNN